MNPHLIVSALLEDLPGVDQQTLDKIMDIIIGVVDRVKTGNPRVDRPRFEQEVNPLLTRWGIQFKSDDEILMKYGPPARAGIDGVVIATPMRISRDEFSSIREIVSHELVHGDQITRAMQTGNAAKMIGSAHRRMMPGGKLDFQKYHTDPHEVAAYARTFVDKMRRRKATRSQALQMLRTQPVRPSDTPASHKRFLKHAAGYAEQLPEK